MLRSSLIAMLIVPAIAHAQKVTDSSSILECKLQVHERSKAVAASSLCNDLLETRTRDKGTLAFRAEILKLLELGYFPVSDLRVKLVGPPLTYSIRQVEGYIEFSRDFRNRETSDILILSFGGILHWNQRSGGFFLHRPHKTKYVHASQVELTKK